MSWWIFGEAVHHGANFNRDFTLGSCWVCLVSHLSFFWARLKVVVVRLMRKEMVLWSGGLTTASAVG